MISCSEDDSNSNNTSTTDFLPLNTGNYWVYDVTNESEFSTSGRDSLYISGDMQLNGNTYKKFQTEELAWGFYSGALADNGVRKFEDKLLLTGTATLNFGVDFPLDIDVADMVILKENATNNQVLGSVANTVTQSYDGYDLDFDYILSSVAKQDMASLTVNGETYNNIKVVEIKLNLEVTAVAMISGIEVPYVVMDAQDVVVSTQYYAENIGVVKVETALNYTINDNALFTVELPIPASVSASQEEVLDVYMVQ